MKSDQQWSDDRAQRLDDLEELMDTLEDEIRMLKADLPDRVMMELMDFAERSLATPIENGDITTKEELDNLMQVVLDDIFRGNYDNCMSVLSCADPFDLPVEVGANFEHTAYLTASAWCKHLLWDRLHEADLLDTDGNPVSNEQYDKENDDPFMIKLDLTSPCDTCDEGHDKIDGVCVNQRWCVKLKEE